MIVILSKCFPPVHLKSYWGRRDDSLTLATIRDDTWNVLNIQQITPHSKRRDYSDTPCSGHKKIKAPAHMVEGVHHLRKAPNPHSLLIWAWDFLKMPMWFCKYTNKSDYNSYDDNNNSHGHTVSQTPAIRWQDGHPRLLGTSWPL